MVGRIVYQRIPTFMYAHFAYVTGLFGAVVKIFGFREVPLQLFFISNLNCH